VTLLDTLTWLVNTPSVTGDEERICGEIIDRLRGTYTDEEMVRVGNSVVIGRRTGKPLMVLYGHTDTVPVQGNATARLEGERLFGLGTSDMKSGVAVEVELLEDPRVLSGPFDVVGVFYDKEEGPAAENGLGDVLDTVPWLAEAAFSIILEPTDLRLELGCNGVLNADVIFRGQAAHSARPWWGENAITKAGSWLAKLHAMEADPVEVAGLTYREVFSVTRASGGIANNVIPAEMVINLNHRFPPIYSIGEAIERLRAVASEADDVIIRDKANPGLIPQGNPHLERLIAIAGDELAAKQGWTDVARLTERGIDAVNFGPGEVALCHQASESIAVSALDAAYSVMLAFLVEAAE
jgi:succinyl-diaminopimelate desuccinylase